MKKSATLQALLAAMLCTFSCMKETDFGTGPAPEGYYEEIITTVIPGGGTRTSFDNTTGVFSWSDGDEIAFHLSNGEYITAPINPETGKVRLYLPEGVTRDEFAVYPASTIVTDHAEKGDMQLTLPDSYDISGTLQSEYCPTTMLAVQDPESSTLRFNHAGGLVQLNLEVPAQTKSVKVEFPDRVVTGTIPVSADNTYYKLDLDDPEHNEEGGSEIDIKVSQEGLEEDTAVRINVPVPSGTYDKLKITYNDGEDDTLEYTKNSSFTLGRSGGKRISPDQSDFVDAKDYFHFIALEDNSSVTLTMAKPESQWMRYSTDGKRTWQTYNSGTTVELNKNDIVWFYNITNQLTLSQSEFSHFTGTGSLKAAGILATLRGQNPNYNRIPNATYQRYDNWNNYAYYSLFSEMTALKDAGDIDMGGDYNIYYYGFAYMFKNCTSLTIAPELPATTLAGGCAACYYHMFENCTSLIAAPDLPATTVAGSAYHSMFKNCTSLTKIPEILPATTLGYTTCYEMFEGCTSITSAPDLPATSIDEYTYYKMFANCTALEYGPEHISATNIKDYACQKMFSNCISLITVPDILPATTIGSRGCMQMFEYCTSLTKAPNIAATTLSNQSLSSMFCGCEALVTPPEELSALTAPSQCYYYMFSGCISLTTAPIIKAETAGYHSLDGMFIACYSLTNVQETLFITNFTDQASCNQMFKDCTSLTKAPNLPATTLYSRCYDSMFMSCSSLITPPTLPAMNLGDWCYVNMFSRCTSLTKAPELPATTLTEKCYEGMFANCTSLNEITCMATDMSATDCLKNWVNNVASTGTFYRNIAATDWNRGTSGIPSDWTVYTIEDVTPQI